MDHFSHRLGFFMSVVHHFGGGHLGEKLTHSNLDLSHFERRLTQIHAEPVNIGEAYVFAYLKYKQSPILGSSYSRPIFGMQSNHRLAMKFFLHF